MTMTRAEQVALSCVAVLIGGVTVPYVADMLGLGVAPLVSAVAAAAIGAGVAAFLHRSATAARADLAILAAIVCVVIAYLLWLTWPSLLPPGGGPDLTHHLVLIDYIERHGTLVHEADANGLLGEMADYTPGLHLLAVLAGALTRAGGFAAVYPVIAISVALKAGIFFLIVTRLLAHHAQGRAMASAALGMWLHASIYSVHSFTRDSFFAQVVSELFAVVMWWALVAWWQQPARSAMVIFAAAGVAAFLTWPIWVGAPALACALVVTGRRELPFSARAADLAVALAPIAAVGVFHTLGRTSAVGIAGTSGAVMQPSPLLFGWWLPALAAAGFVVAATDRRYRVVLVFAGTLALQAAALLVIARRSGADTPYMAIKMTYLGIYPLIAAIVIGIALVARTQVLAWTIAFAVVATGVREISTASPPVSVVSHDLWSAGRWARQNLQPGCVDYLVGNPDTAYWLHLAVLGNRRASDRTNDNDTYDTQRAFERWLTGDGPPYAIANLRVVPTELLRDTRVIHRTSSAAVVQRLNPSSVRDAACASPLTPG